MDKMRHTIDKLTGLAFRWNTTVFYCGFNVPARCTAHDMVNLHPSRVPYPLLRDLNPDKPDEEIRRIAA